ncbi:hypothetical protein AB0G74_03850 [Streptomyces sp. NPDC020875]|uniref:hypothetical protein n=1 Tax=Streptomyces sp. NPDC020875 TaxID=3154898 RepID=UPI0033C1A48A
MAKNYPLVLQREYGSPEKRGGFLRRRATRNEDGLPPIAAHHVRVFRVGEEYVTDHGLLRADDPVVLGAASVTVVDLRVETPVTVETRVPSAGTAEFTVRAVFSCTVTDPCAVVRDGVTDAEALLTAHLREVPGLTEDGRDLPVDASAVLRARIDARLTAYHEMRPAVVSGMRVRRSLVQVFSPEEMTALTADMERARLEQERDLQREELDQEAALKREERKAKLQLKREELRRLQADLEEENRRDEELDKERNRQGLDTLRTRYERIVGSDAQEHELILKARGNRAARAELAEDVRLIDSDPAAADFLAWQQGDISADELAGRLRQAEKERAERRDDGIRLDREELRRRDELDREERRFGVERDVRREELDRAERREEAAALRQEEQRQWNLDREDRVLRRQEDRADAAELRQDRSTWAREQLATRADVFRRAIDRGLFDSVHDADAFINSLGDVPYDQSPAAGGDWTAEERATGGRPVDGRTVEGRSMSGRSVEGRETTAAEPKGELDQGAVRRPADPERTAPGPKGPGPGSGSGSMDEPDDDGWDLANQEAHLGD